MASAEGGECLLARDVPADDQLSRQLGTMTLEEREEAKSFNTMVFRYSNSSKSAFKRNTNKKFGAGQALLSDLINRPEDEDEVEQPKAEDKEETVAVKEKVKETAGELVKEEEAEKKENKENDEIEVKKVEEEKKEEKIEKKEGEEKEKEEDEKKEEETEGKVKAEGDEEEEEEDEEVEGLVSRGPVRHAKSTAACHSHPYTRDGRHNATAPQSHLDDYTSFSAYGSGYECGASTWQDSPETFSSISTPDTTDTGYAPSISPSTPSVDGHITTQDLTRLLISEFDMPDRLVDFILSYSRLQYGYDDNRTSGAEVARPGSADSSYADSPMSAGSVPHHSPGQPMSGNTGRSSSPQQVMLTSSNLLRDRPARMRFRASICQEDLEKALVWVVKCIEAAKGALEYQDLEGDSLLHILLYNCDSPRTVAKVYALVEQQQKQQTGEKQAFDLKNRFHETPLYIATILRNQMLVEYLLEAGANPNVLPLRASRDPALHYAASRAMTDIVKAFLAEPRTNRNMLNGKGQTALHCAVLCNGAIDEETGHPINTIQTVQELLAGGVDPFVVSSSDGKTVMHIATEKRDVEMLDALRHSIKEEAMTELVNKADFNHERPMQLCQAMKDRLNAQDYKPLCLSLMMCGADVQ